MWKVYVYGLLKQSEKSVRSPISGGAVSFEQLHVSIKPKLESSGRARALVIAPSHQPPWIKHLIHIKAVCALFYKEIV